MITSKGNARSIAYEKKFREIRNNTWPELAQIEVWHPKSSKGYTQVPKIMPLFLCGVDSIEGNKKMSQVYFALWCRSTVGVVEVESEQAMALESGFTGQRAVGTWRERIRSLAGANIIKTAPGFGCDFGFILLRNPYVVLAELKGRMDPGIYNTAIARANRLGAGKEIRGD